MEVGPGPCLKYECRILDEIIRLTRIVLLPVLGVPRSVPSVVNWQSGTRESQDTVSDRLNRRDSMVYQDSCGATHDKLLSC